ncbi:MAG: hypothetical protein JRI68_23995 [Deltaproteobacteria bacterium]|nr:hypothetical protein [Deltaproteobacteria bacterium]
MHTGIALCLGALVTATPTSSQATEPVPTAEGDGATEAEEQEPGSGALDLRQRVASQVLQTNVVLWSAPVVGALGMTDVSNERVSYGGLYLSPTALLPPRVGQWVAGASAVKTAEGWSHEVQTEYRCPYGFGVGGGYLDPPAGRLTRFGKVSYDHALGPIRLVAAAVAQDAQGSLWPGGYGGLIWEHLMGTFGHDGEQWLATFGFVAPEWSTRFRPAVEVFFIDGTPGDQAGTRFLFINGTLVFKHPFLSHAVRLGRGLLPYGMQMANPLGYLSATWNRAPEVWELGRVLNFRVMWEQAPDESVNALYEGDVYPFHLDEQDNLGDVLFVGGFYRERPVDPAPGVVVGVSGPLGPLHGTVGLDYEITTSAFGGTGTLGIPF